MIKTENLVPQIYYKRSRDFQLLGRIYDFVFNYLKTNIDMVETNPFSDNSDSRLLELVSTTLGFKKAHEYNVLELNSLCSIFAKSIREKGTQKSIDNILNLLANVQNTSEAIYSLTDANNPYLLDIYLPTIIEDTSLLEDVLDYILPAGMSYRIIKQRLNTYEDEDEYDFEDPDIIHHTKHDTTFVKSVILQYNESGGQQEILPGHPSEDTGLPTPSDIGAGRIDNMTLAPLPDDAND